MNRRLTISIFLSMALFVLTGIPSLCRGADELGEPGDKWEKYVADKWGVIYYYDKDSVVMPTMGILKLWRKRDFRVGSAQKEIISYDEIDCVKQKYRSLQLRVVGQDDKVETTNRVLEWATIYGDHPEEWFLDNTCRELMRKK